MKRFWQVIAVFAAVIGILSLCACSSQNQKSENASQSSAVSNKTEEVEKECNWTMEVSDTVTAQVQGYEFTCTLAIMAVKLGGLDELGTLGLDTQISIRHEVQHFQRYGEGQEIDAVIEVVKYDKENTTSQRATRRSPNWCAMTLWRWRFILSGSGKA